MLSSIVKPDMINIYTCIPLSHSITPINTQTNGGNIPLLWFSFSHLLSLSFLPFSSVFQYLIWVGVFASSTHCPRDHSRLHPVDLDWNLPSLHWNHHPVLGSSLKSNQMDAVIPTPCRDSLHEPKSFWELVYQSSTTLARTIQDMSEFLPLASAVLVIELVLCVRVRQLVSALKGEQFDVQIWN